MASNILVGSDPEVFVMSNKGSIIPSIGLIGGSKNEPRDIGIGSLQEDNVLAEFNIKPAATKQQFIDNIKSVMQALEEAVYPHKLSIQASHIFDMNILNQYGEAAFRFGCDPDYDAWNKVMNTPPVPELVGGLRSAGGHIHVGVELEDQDAAANLAATMDLLLGIPAVILDTDMDRRRLYGKAGAFRFKPYGIEYRTLSNFWLKSDELIGWAYDNTIMAANVYPDLMHMIKKSGYGPNILCDIINHGLVEPAKKVIKALSIPMP